MIYFDNAATTRIDAEVLEAMIPFMESYYGNSSSKYGDFSKYARESVEWAREQVAFLLGTTVESIVFTTGATEATNLIIKGYLDYRMHYGDGKNHVITTKADHKASINVCKFLSGEIYSNHDAYMSLSKDLVKVDRGYCASFADVDETGSVLIKSIKNEINNRTALVSTIWVNNEVGSINNVKEIGMLCRANNVAFHIDATQALGKIDIVVSEIGCDFLSCSAHKIHGPKGIGAAVLKSDEYGIQPISALLHGGEQENGFRAGTLAVHNIVGFGKAAEIAMRDREKDRKHIKILDEYLVSEICKIPTIRLTNPSALRVPGIVSIIVDSPDFNNERFIMKVSDKVALSTGSACTAGKPSHVLQAMGMGEMTNKVLRLSLSKYSTKEEVDELVSLFKNLL